MCLWVVERFRCGWFKIKLNNGSQNHMDESLAWMQFRRRIIEDDFEMRWPNFVSESRRGIWILKLPNWTSWKLKALPKPFKLLCVYRVATYLVRCIHGVTAYTGVGPFKCGVGFQHVTVSWNWESKTTNRWYIINLFNILVGCYISRSDRFLRGHYNFS